MFQLLRFGLEELIVFRKTRFELSHNPFPDGTFCFVGWLKPWWTTSSSGGVKSTQMLLPLPRR